MKILMFGWELPPFHSGGLGVACEGLTKALLAQGAQVLFVLPKKFALPKTPFPVLFANEQEQKSRPFSFDFSAYSTLVCHLGLSDKNQKAQKAFAPSDLLAEVFAYAQNARKIAVGNDFDVIHVHDWLCIPAGIAAKEVSGKPLVVHIHATEFDRSGSLPHPLVYAIEEQGMQKAERVVAVSEFTKNKIIDCYGIEERKIRVVYNAVDNDFSAFSVRGANELLALKREGHKIVVFVGRITLQKGPDYFLRAAQKVLAYKPKVFFVIAGSGDMHAQIIEQAVHLGIADKVFFAGFVRGEELKKIYLAADLFVMPSVSEPFGITALEAVSLGVPIVISKQSGVQELIRNALKVDFWDIEEMANKILACLDYSVLPHTLKEESQKDLAKISWHKSAQQCVKIYQELCK